MLSLSFVEPSHPTDDEKPVIVGCPTDIVNTTDLNAATGTVNWTLPTVTDNSGLVTLTSSHNTSDSFPIGTTEVNYTAVDGAGNMADVCRFNVTITGRVKQFACSTIFYVKFAFRYSSCFSWRLTALVVKPDISFLI